MPTDEVVEEGECSASETSSSTESSSESTDNDGKYFIYLFKELKFFKIFIFFSFIN